MIVRLLSVGAPGKLLAPAISEFEGRASRYWKFRSETVRAGAGGAAADAEQVRVREEARLRARLAPRGEVLALTRGGRGMTSQGLARFLERKALAGVPEVAFLIGGAFGIGSTLLEEVDRKLSLSPLTLPHDLARLVLVEQLYRAGSILRGEPYHKGEA